MTTDELQRLCEEGQQRLMATDYIGAEAPLERAEAAAWEAKDWDTLSRLYMPLQEVRRQRRQRCGEGVVRLDLLLDDVAEVDALLATYAHGQLLVAGHGSIEPAVRVRDHAERNGLYLETYLAAWYAVGAGKVVAIVPLAEVSVPGADVTDIDVLIRQLPPQSIVVPADEFHRGERRGDDATFAETMAVWERLHAPFLAAADSATDPLQRMIGYRLTTRVDPACELAHQRLSDAARVLLKSRQAG